jgi:hypothetical protein
MEFKYLKKRLCGAGILALALLFTSGVAFGQAQTGNLFVHVTDEQGGVLPGVLVTLSGMGAPITQVSNANGDVRFLSLSPGAHTVDFAISGFAKVTRKNVVIAVGQNTEITTTMKLSAVQEQVVVTAESPLLDTKRSGSQTTVSRVELESAPTARDPWVIMNTAPGVQVDRVNVGGSESGQQSNNTAKGTINQGTWNVDGINISDAASGNSSPAYYDFDSFAEINMAIGGADASIASPGTQMNLVTKRGTNDVHGSARLYYESKKTSSNNVTDEVIADTVILGRPPGAGNSINQLQDYGAELGGPVVKDMLWLWGSYGRNQIDLVVPGGSTDKTTLFNYSFKLNFQAVPENSFNAQYLNNDKQKFGRNAGPNHPQETTWDQTGPTKIYKLEDSHIFSPNMFATATYARVMGGFALISEGRAQTFLDTNGVYHGSYEDYITQRPQTQASITPSFFLRTGNVGHEIKAGFNYRKTPIASVSSFPAGIVGIQDGGVLFGINPTGQDLAMFYRDNAKNYEFTTYSGFISDTLTMGKLTGQIGVRYDRQSGQNNAYVVAPPLYSQTAFPQAPLTGLNVPGTTPLIWKDFAPRAALSYAIDDKTIARASYARFVSGMNNLNVNQNSAAPGGTYLFYPWNDANHNNLVDAGEADFTNLVTYIGWDPAHPNNVDPSLVLGKVDYNMKSPKTDEFVLSFERELLPAFLVSLSGTYRKFTDFTEFVQLTADGSRAMTPADYVCTPQGPYPVPNGSPQMINVCNPKPGIAGIGTLEQNRPGYYQTYVGVDFAAVKRYSDKWMARFNFTWNNWTQHDTAAGNSGLSPGGGFVGNGGDPSNLVGGTTVDGGPVLYQSTGSGSKTYVYINSKWQGTLSAMYTLPLDFNISTTLFGRQGFAAPYYTVVNSANNPLLGSKNYQLGGADDLRNATVFEWDLGIGKAVRVGGLTATVQADCFNVLNRATALERNLRVRSTATTASPVDNYVYELQSPRIWRLGLRLGF